jgi:AAA family ATP:ADP antiporter
VQRRDEVRWTIGASSACAAFMLAGYEFVRSASNTLFKEAYGWESFPAVMAGLPVVLVVTLFVYGRLLTALGPRKTFAVTTAGSAVLLLACYGAIRAGSEEATVLLYWLREVYVVLLLEQLWSFVNSSLTVDEAKPRTGMLMGIGSVGAVIGGELVARTAEGWGTPQLLLAGAACLIPTAWALNLAFRKVGEPRRDDSGPVHSVGSDLGLRDFLTTPLLWKLLVLVVLTQVLSAVLTIRFQEAVSVGIVSADAQTAYQGRFYAFVNGTAMLGQFVVTPLLLSRGRMRWIFFAIPLLHLATTGTSMLMGPELWIASAALLLFKALDYSVWKGAKELLYIPLSFDVRYRAKEVIDVFGYRFGKGGMSGLLAVAQGAGASLSGLLGWAALGAAVLWVGLTGPVLKDAGDEVTRGE